MKQNITYNFFTSVKFVGLNIEGFGLSNFTLSNVSASMMDGTLSFEVLHPELFITGNHLTKGTANGSPFDSAGNFSVVVKSE